MSDRVGLPTAPVAAFRWDGWDRYRRHTTHDFPSDAWEHPGGGAGRQDLARVRPAGQPGVSSLLPLGRMRRLLPKARLAPWSGPAGGPRCFFSSLTPLGRRRWLPEARLLLLPPPTPGQTRCVPKGHTLSGLGRRFMHGTRGVRRWPVPHGLPWSPFLLGGP